MFSLSLYGSPPPWEFGKYKFVRGAPSSPLKVKKKSLGGLLSLKFLSGVGGVDFDGIAVPSTNLKNREVKINYNPKEADGYRMSVEVDGSYYYPYIPDWQLIPTASFADSEYDACVSLFGEATNAYNFDITYHPALENTLLGLRLLHADVMFMDLREFKELPRIDGNVLIGEGETNNISSNWDASAKRIEAVLEKYEPQSWVLTDDDITVKFSISNTDCFELTGEPNYFLWKSEFDISKLSSYDMRTLEREFLREGASIDEDKLKKLKDKATRVISLSNAIHQLRKIDLKDLNEDVYTAAENTMRYSAFFRYIKKTSPENWNSFLKSVKKVNPNPTVETPTTWGRR